MAPYTPEPARSTQSKANRPTPVAPRIIPAIPLALSRTPRASVPTIPEDANTSLAAAPPEEAEEAGALASGEKLSEEQPPAQTEAPLTPESRASGLSHDEVAEDTPGSSSSRDLGVNDGDTEITRESTLTAERPETAELVLSPTVSDPPREPVKELPPPFYPAEHSSTPTSTTSSAIHNFQPPTRNSSIHHPRPSTGSIVFGGFPDSPSSSPVPPLGMGGYAAPPPGFVPGNFAHPPYFTPGHTHHPSDHNSHMTYPPMNIIPPMTYAFRRDHPPEAIMSQHRPWYPNADHVPPHHIMHQESYAPRQESALLNGTAKHSRAASPTSSRTQEWEFKNIPESNTANKSSTKSNGTYHNVTDPMAESYRSELIDYTYSRFGDPEYADRFLDVGCPGAVPFLSIPIHRVIAARSTVLALALSAPSESYHNGLKTAQLVIEDAFITGQALTEAIKFLYGAPLPLPSKFSEGLQAFDCKAKHIEPHDLARQRMDQALGFTAAGFILQIPAVADRGIDIALHILRWDNLERALDFALHGGLSVSFDDTRTTSSPTQLPTYSHYSSSLLLGIVSFISLSFPMAFRLNSAAPQLSGSPLIPKVVEPRPTTHHPRLSMIRFGEIPLEDTPQPTFATNLLSSILLSLPFPVLRSLFDSAALGGKVGWPAVVEVANSVIEERENRRQKSLKSYSKGGLSSATDRQLLENLHWEERIEQSDKLESGFTIVRTRKTASPSAAEAVSTN